MATKKNSPKEIALIDKIEQTKLKNLIAISLLFLFYIFYFTQNLFYVNNLNDFGEYFTRAEQWTRGEPAYGAGMDKLLSMIEFLPIYFFKNNFFTIYRTTNIIIFTLLFLAIGIFLFKKNNILPNFYLKLLIAIFLLTMPFFTVSSLTIDQTLLFSVMLIFFLCTYNNPYLGIVSLFVYLSRPESLIIIPLYFLLWLIDKENRKKIVINFISFFIIFIIFQYINLTFLNPGTNFLQQYSNVPIIDTKETATDVVKNISNETKLPWIISFFIELLKLILYIPLMIFIYGMEILQNYFLLILFSLGLIFSISDKKMYIFYGIFISYILLNFAAGGFKADFPFKQSFTVFGAKLSFFNSSITIANGREMEYGVLGHSRYRLFFYLPVAAFVIAGIYRIFNLIELYYSKNRQTVQKHKIFSNSQNKPKKQNTTAPIQNQNINQSTLLSKFNKLKQLFTETKLTQKQYITISLIFLIFFINNVYAYINFSKQYRFKTQMQSPYIYEPYHLAFKIREHQKPGDVVMFPGMCMCNVSFICEFEVFSGTRYLFMPFCKDCREWYTINKPDSIKNLKPEQVYKLSPSGFCFWDYGAIDYHRSFNPKALQQIDKLYKFDLNMLDSLHIKFLIVNQDINKNNLSKIDQRGQFRLYLNTNLK